MHQEEQLIELNLPAHSVNNEKELPSPSDYDTSGATTKSETVVHTRRTSVSSESTPSAALQLFENDITFDHQAQSSRGQREQKAPFPFPHLSTTGSARRVRSGSEAGRDQPSLAEDNLSTKAALGSEVPKGDSFLDLPALGGPFSQGRGSGSTPRPHSTTDLLSAEKRGTPKRGISLFPKKHRSAHWLNRVTPPSESPGSSSIPSSKTLTALLTPTPTSEVGEKTHPLLEGSPLHRLSPTHLLQRVRKKRMQRAGTLTIRNELEPPATALESLTNLSQAQQVPSHTKPDRSPVSDGKVLSRLEGISAEAEVTPMEIREDMYYLKKEVAKVDKLKWMKERKASDPLQTDTAWIEGTIKDITEKGDRVKNNPASTSTITTTGCVRPVSVSNQSNENKTKAARPMAESNGSRKPHRAVSDMASKISPQNRRQSSLLRLTSEGQIVPIDITSMEPLSQDPPRKEVDHYHRASTFTFAKGPEKENAILVADYLATFPETRGNSGQHLGEARVQDPLLSRPGTRPQTPEKRSKDQIYGHQQESTHQRPLQNPEQLLQSLIQAIPGAYPCRLEDEGDTDDLFAAVNMGQAIQHLRDLGNDNGDLWDATKEFLFVARCHIEVTLRLYWSVAGPVFDSRSQYWMRNNKGNATLLDGLAFVLAVPGAFLGLLVFV